LSFPSLNERITVPLEKVMTRALIITIAASFMLCVLLTAGGSAHPAWGIVVDRNNQIYFSDIENIWKIDAQGKLSLVRAGRDHTHDLNIDDAGNLYGAENSYDPATQRFFSAIWKMTPGGSSSYLLAPTENPPLGTSIWKDRDGNMYHVTNFPEHELLVLKRTPSGDVVQLVGSSNALRSYHQASPYSIGGIAFGTDGALYFTHGANASKVTTSGALSSLARNVPVESAPGKPAEETRLFGIVVDAQRDAFVADYNNRRILKITSAGATSTVARADPPWSPTGLALKDGNLYILEFGFTPPSTYTPRVRKLTPDGRMTLLATVGENDKATVSESNSVVSSAQSASSKPSLRLILLALGVGLLALTLVIWGVRRRKSIQQL
jgi:hypothetical protein